MTVATTVIVAECGHKLAIGDRAFSHYTFLCGEIGKLTSTWDDWFDFVQDDGTKPILNGQRVCCIPCAKRFGYSKHITDGPTG